MTDTSRIHISHALFIGHTYIDVTVLTDVWPTSDDKSLVQGYAVSFGESAVTATFACAKLSMASNIMLQVKPDWLGRMFYRYRHGLRHKRLARVVKNVRRFFLIQPQHSKPVVCARDDN